MGVAGVSGRELAVQGAVSHFREFLIGKDPMRIGALWQEMAGKPFEFWEAPHLHRRDGSYTNW